MARITKISRCSAVCRALCNTVKIFLRAAPASTISHASLSLSPTLFSARMKNTRKRPSGQEESRVRAATMKRIYRGEHKLDIRRHIHTPAYARSSRSLPVSRPAHLHVREMNPEVDWRAPLRSLSRFSLFCLFLSRCCVPCFPLFFFQ